MYRRIHLRWLMAGPLVLALLAPRLNGLTGPETVLIRGGTLIDGSGAEPRADVRILVEGDVVKDIWTAGDPAGKREPVGARIIDTTGKFIIPGLVDSHVHYREYMGDLFLSHGVTTVVDLGNPYYWLKAIQDGLNTGRFRGPRFYFCGGPGLSATEEMELPSISRRNTVFGVMQRVADAEQIVATTKKQADCLKLSEAFPGDLFSSLAREARAAGLAVISHSLQAVDSADWGITGIEHMVGIAIATIRDSAGRKALAGMRTPAGHKNSFLYQWMEERYFDEVIRHLVERGVYVNPTLAFEWKALSDRAAAQESEDARLFHRPGLQYVPLDERLLALGQYRWADDRSAAEREQFTKGYRKVQKFLGRFVKAGGRVYAGTDSAAATTPGLSLHHEMELLVDAGLSPMQALQAASKNGADLFGLSKVGTVAVGKWADMVILRDSPLADVRNSKNIEMVMKGGRVVELGYDSAHVLPIPHPGPISKHLYNPVPTIADILPAVATRGPAATLRITGRGFVAGSMVTVDGHLLKVNVISPTELSVQLPSALTSQTGAYHVRVDNPKPGGGESNAVPFYIVER